MKPTCQQAKRVTFKITLLWQHHIQCECVLFPFLWLCKLKFLLDGEILKVVGWRTDGAFQVKRQVCSMTQEMPSSGFKEEAIFCVCCTAGLRLKGVQQQARFMAMARKNMVFRIKMWRKGSSCIWWTFFERGLSVLQWCKEDATRFPTLCYSVQIHLSYHTCLSLNHQHIFSVGDTVTESVLMSCLLTSVDMKKCSHSSNVIA